MEATALTPHQEEIRDELLRLGGDVPPVDRSIAQRLRADIAAKLSRAVADLPTGQRVWVSKHRLRQVYECEGQFLAESAAGWTGWSSRNVRGKVAHRALEGLILSGYRRTPLDVVRAAIANLAAGDDDLATFIRNLADGQRQDLVRDANNLLVRFVADWPPVEDRWWPTVEMTSDFGVGPVRLRAIVDLAVRPRFAAGPRMFIVDFKTGMVDRQHRDDLRFYALVETLRSRVAPYRVATYYLDTGDYDYEDVDEELLRSTLDRVVEGVQRVIRVETGGEPVLEAGTYCRYCPVLPGCDPGREWMSVFARPPAGP